ILFSVTLFSQEMPKENRFYNPFSKDISLGPGTLSLGGSLRFRYEYMNNYSLVKYGTKTSDDVLYERVMLNFRYKTKHNINFFLEVYDAHFRLNEYSAEDFSGACSHQNPFDLKQLFIEINPIPGIPVGFKVGRQEISYGDTRIWGPGHWSNSGKYNWDAVKLFLNVDVFNLDILYGKRLIADPEKIDMDHYPFQSGGLYMTLKKLPFMLDLFYVGKLDRRDSTKGESGYGKLFLNTIGSHIKGGINKFDYKATAAGQVGKYGKDDAAAYAVNVFLGYIIEERFQSRLMLGYTYANGDKEPDDGRHQTFDGVFGAVAQYYGRMNKFFWMNIHDLQADFSIKPLKKISALVSYHYFCLVQSKDAWYDTSGKPHKNRIDKTGKSGTDLGQELDLIISTAVNKNIKIQIGYAHFFPGNFIKNTGNGDPADWAYAQTALSF
ncbi:MAG: alginate export family protein, partial [bacterium]